MALEYRLKNNTYHLYDLDQPPSRLTGEHPLRLRTESIAIAFDARTGELRDHGSPARIQCWASNARRRLRASGALDEANSLVVVSGPFPVDEANKCLRVAGYCRSLMRRLATLPHGKLGMAPAH